MNFLKYIFSKKEETIASYSDFWQWFEKNEKKFYQVIKDQGNIEGVFFDELGPKLNELREGFWYLTGMYDDNTAELVLTADGVIKNMVFVEELVNAAPKFENWIITALKQPSDLNQYGINMGGYKFDETTMSFFSNINQEMPDEIDITITHRDLNENNRETITNGVFLALENTLGEINLVTSIDNVDIVHPDEATADLISIEKLRDFLVWREKEFREKYQGYRYATENDSYAGLKATKKNGLPVYAVVNTDLLNWDGKASHPWIVNVNIAYDSEANNGFPNNDVYRLLDVIEDEIMLELKDFEGYLNVGRVTADSTREIYFACIEFRKPSKVLSRIVKKYQQRIALDFEIYRDKYWQSLNQFSTNLNYES